MTDPQNHVATYAYDAANQFIGSTDRDGRQIQYAYDAAGRRTTKQWLNAQGQVTATMTYTFDAANCLTAESDPNSAYAYTYDSNNRLTKVDNAGTPGAPHSAETAGRLRECFPS